MPKMPLAGENDKVSAIGRKPPVVFNAETGAHAPARLCELLWRCPTSDLSL